jgi:hypothetical protein
VLLSGFTSNLDVGVLLLFCTVDPVTENSEQFPLKSLRKRMLANLLGDKTSCYFVSLGSSRFTIIFMRFLGISCVGMFVVQSHSLALF